MSRPTASVPSGKDELPPSMPGRQQEEASADSVSFGVCGATSGANSATTRMKVKTARPMTAPLFREK